MAKEQVHLLSTGDYVKEGGTVRVWSEMGNVSLPCGIVLFILRILCEHRSPIPEYICLFSVAVIEDPDKRSEEKEDFTTGHNSRK